MIELVPVETVMQELHCSRRQAYAHMGKMTKVKIGHGLVTRESLEQYKRNRMEGTAHIRPTQKPKTQPARGRSASIPPPGQGTVAERYPRIRKVDL